MKIRKEDALEYHSMGRKGKIEVITTKPCITQRDLSLAYSPGVAEPCREIDKDVSKVFDYTAKGNLVAVISNGTAVLGLGDIGPEAGKPVMEGKGVLFKAFADIDVFDIELRSKDVDEIVRTCEVLEPTFGGINLEDIKGPECFYIEERLKKSLKIPVFHDDQHGTAIISGAALLNALEINGKKIEDCKAVYNGAGASGIACANFHISLGLKRENVIMCDSRGVIYKGRESGMNEFKDDFAVETDRRTLEEALVDADLFFGLSQGNCVSKEMVKNMAPDPIIFAMANPDPEIAYEDAVDARPDVIMATGRSDYPNQVNNVLGFPFIFRGALDVSATAINEEMKRAAAYALAKLAKESVPDSVKKAYGVEELTYGREYIIPKPFDPRVLTWVAPAVAQAAMDTGVATRPIEDFDVYRRALNVRMGRADKIMTRIYQKARNIKPKVVLPEGNHHKIIKAAQIALDYDIASPVLLGNKEEIESVAAAHGYDMTGLEIIDPKESKKTQEYIDAYYKLRQRKGVTKLEAEKRLKSRLKYFGAMMVGQGDACAMISGVAAHYPDTITPALEIIGKEDKYSKVSGLYVVINKKDVYFLADTTVNVDPTAEELADIAMQSADFVRTFDIEPKVALLSYSNFGSKKGETPQKMQKALKIVQEKMPELRIDGEMQGNVATEQGFIDRAFPFANIKGKANTLIFPELNSGNISYKLLKSIGGANLIGPVLLGLKKSVHVLQKGCDIHEIVDMIAIAAVDVEHKEEDCTKRS